VTIEDRLAALEQRLRRAEDQLEIIRLLNTYGPAVDSGASQEAAHLWIEGGIYDVGGGSRRVAFEELCAMYDSAGHQGLVHQGCAHLTATPRITVKDDTAQAVAYSFVVLKSGDENAWHFMRAAVNYWTLTRTADGWRIVERFNRVLDGSKASHDTMRKAFIAEAH
jgi:hypothetical protein